MKLQSPGNYTDAFFKRMFGRLFMVVEGEAIGKAEALWGFLWTRFKRGPKRPWGQFAANCKSLDEFEESLR